LEFTV